MARLALPLVVALSLLLGGCPTSPEPADQSTTGTETGKGEPDPSATDTDHDGLTDAREAELGTDPTQADTDADGLSDADELRHSTDPVQADTDGDGLKDGEENKLGTDPLKADTDEDGLNDGKEVALGTNPTVTDTDKDGLEDGEEVTMGTNPLVADTDGDGLDDGKELALETSPLLSDSDGDGLTDADEVRIGTDPKRSDTDRDGIRDAVEVEFSLDPLTPTTTMRVSEVYCGDFVAVDLGPGLATQVYESMWNDETFGQWRGADLVILLDDVFLVNLSRREKRAVYFRGNIVFDTKLVARSATGDRMTLANAGFPWNTSVDRHETAYWAVGDRIVVTVELDTYREPEFWYFVDVNRCARILAFPLSYP